MRKKFQRFHARHLLCVGAMVVLCGCSAFAPTTTLPPAFYSLDNARPASASTTRSPASKLAPTLIVNPPHAAAGFDSQRMVYVREPHKLEYFANSEWVDPPARMLGALLVDALEKTGGFAAVVLTPGAAAGQLRLDTHIIRLQQDFTQRPSQVRFTLRAYLVDDKSRSVIVQREFNGYASAATDNPSGGVVAANAAVQDVLAQLAAFCADAVQTTDISPLGTQPMGR